MDKVKYVYKYNMKDYFHEGTPITDLPDDINAKVGVVVGIQTEEGLAIGFSRCNPTDKFSKKKAVELAKRRALVWQEKDIEHNDINYMIQKNLHNMFKWRGESERQKFEDAIGFIRHHLTKGKSC